MNRIQNDQSGRCSTEPKVVPKVDAVCFGCERHARCQLIEDPEHQPPIIPLCDRCYPPRIPAELFGKEKT